MGAVDVEPLYHRAEEVYAALAALAADRPGVVVPFEVGRSVQDRPILGYRLVDPATPPRGAMLVFANIHAMEWVPTEVALSFAVDFARFPEPGVELVVIPSLNVDGRARVESDLAEGRDVYRRGNANNVDLNRDFGVNREARALWKAIIPRRYAVSPGPLSQPESQALDQLASAEQFDVAVSLHAFGGFFYYPWAGLWGRAPHHAELQRLGELMQAAMSSHPYKPRQLSRWAFFFRGHGMEIDHLYGKHGALSFLVETTRSGYEEISDLAVKFRMYNPRDPHPHAAEGVRYLRALAHEVAQGRASRVAR